jgi:hypothetical protein
VISATATKAKRAYAPPAIVAEIRHFMELKVNCIERDRMQFAVLKPTGSGTALFYSLQKLGVFLITLLPNCIAFVLHGPFNNQAFDELLCILRGQSADGGLPLRKTVDISQPQFAGSLQ